MLDINSLNPKEVAFGGENLLESLLQLHGLIHKNCGQTLMYAFILLIVSINHNRQLYQK